MSRLDRILIAGGGIAGLTAATALRLRGFEVELIERSASWDAPGAGIAVQPNGMRALRALGLGAAVERRGAVVRRWLFRDLHGAMLCEADLGELWGDVGPFIGIDRAGLQDTLRSGAAAVPCRRGVWVTSLRHTDRRVEVALSDGSRLDYDLVVGADGIASTVRPTAGLGDSAPIYGGQMAWRSLAPISQPELDSVQFWLGDGCFFGLCPVGDGRTYGFGNVTGPRGHEPVEGRLERLRERFAGYGGHVQDYLAALEADEQIHCGPIEWVERELWHSGRVVLIGDAAHASSPMMGQGGCMAMEDALVLAEILNDASGVAEAVDRFVARRRPRVDWVQRESRAVGEMLGRPPDIRNPALAQSGARLLRERFAPLTAPP